MLQREGIESLPTSNKDMAIIKDLMLRLDDKSFLYDLSDPTRNILLQALALIGATAGNAIMQAGLLTTLDSFVDNLIMHFILQGNDK